MKEMYLNAIIVKNANKLIERLMRNLSANDMIEYMKDRGMTHYIINKCFIAIEN